jgi:hypothetical protein
METTEHGADDDRVGHVVVPNAGRKELADPVVSAKLSLKFCHKFAEIRSLKLHAQLCAQTFRTLCSQHRHG